MTLTACINLTTFLLFAFSISLCAAERTTISLDGQWDIADSKAADALPLVYDHKAPVPGLAHSATPPFPDVDEFDSRQVIQNRVAKGMLPKSALVKDAGVSRQNRNWFWYRRDFAVPAVRSVAVLRIDKAQFGAAVWLNGKKIGEHLPCFTAAIFDVSGAVRQGTNELIVRVGAPPGVLPETVSAGTDFEKNRWTPGIYDSVSLMLSENPVIETVQAAPKLAGSSVLIQTEVRNHGLAATSFELTQRVHAWKSAAIVASAQPKTMTLQPGEAATVLQSVRIPHAK